MRCPVCNALNPADSRFCNRCATPLSDRGETVAYDSLHPVDAKDLLELGSLLDGRYRLEAELGRGGMGIVYKAEDIKLKRLVAVKILPLTLSGHREAMQRFAQEARAASMLDHPNICTIYEISETPAGQKYITMAYYEGETLKERLERGPLPLESALDLIIQVSQGLAAAHRIGVVHRDIKPANIMMTREGIVKLVDFGLAKLTGESRLTKTSAILGTTFYMSPEQAQGGMIDARSDLWSLGVIFYEALLCRLPFRGENEQTVLYSIIHKTPPAIREFNKEIPLEVERIIFKCLSKKPEHRYLSAKSLLLDLSGAMQVQEAGGAAESREETAVSDARKEAERRQATVMSVAVEGCPEIMDRFGEEEGAFLIGRCFGLIETELKNYGGHIERMAQGQVVALFGVPQAMEDAPRQAVNAAIALRRSFETFIEKEIPRCPVSLRIGINSGIVIAGKSGETGKEEYTVMGETVSLSSALKDLAPPGKIYVGSPTYRLTQTQFSYRPLDIVYPKGKKQPISAFEILPQVEHFDRPRLGAERMIYSELVGRSEELDRLKLHVLKAITGEGSIVNIVGEAGIGKSRLVNELYQTDDLKKTTVLVGRGLSGGKNLSFHPLIAILKSWAGIKSEDDRDASSQKLERAIRTIDPEGFAEIFPFIARILGLELSGKYAERVRGIQGEALEKLILKTLRDVLVKMARIRPVVMIVEDLHWADPSSIELLESLFRVAESNKILFINIFRPDYSETGDRILRTIQSRYAHLNAEIHLGPLNDSECTVLIENLLRVGMIEGPIRELIARRAEGNPFFIEEVARSFIDDGVVVIENGQFRVTEKIGSVVIPETIADVIMARVDKLDEPTKTLLKLASVIGRNFLYGILAEVGKAVDRLDERLEYLEEVQLIKPKPSGTEVEYLFKHALVREAVYDSILLGKRKPLHLEVARAIEKIFSGRLPEFYGMLALHYSQGEDAEKAEEFLIKAGEEALKVAASSVAINYYQEALNLYLKKQGASADPQKVALLEKNIAVANFNKGHMVEAVEHFDRVLELWGKKISKRKSRLIFDLFVNLIYILYYLYLPSRRGKKIPTARDCEIIYLEEKKGLALTSVDHFKMVMDIIEACRKLNEFDLTRLADGVSLYSTTSALFSYTGFSFGLSRRILDNARKVLDPNDLKANFAYSFYKLTYDYPAGNWEKDRVYDLNLVNANIKMGEIFRSAGYSLWSGLIALEEGKFEEAQQCADKLFEIGDVFEHNYARARGYIVRGKLLLTSGRIEECREEMALALPFLKKAGEKLCYLGALGIKANVQVLLGDIDGAEATLAAARDLVSREKRIVPFFLSNFLKSRFFCEVSRCESSGDKPGSQTASPWKKAQRYGKTALKNAAKFAADRTEIYKLMGTYHWIKGRPDRAERWWDLSIEAGEQLGAKPELARTYLEVGRRLLSGKPRRREIKGIGGEEYLRRARNLFVGMSMTRDLEELEKIEPPRLEQTG